jgi:hypothetical protein
LKTRCRASRRRLAVLNESAAGRDISTGWAMRDGASAAGFEGDGSASRPSNGLAALSGNAGPLPVAGSSMTEAIRSVPDSASAFSQIFPLTQAGIGRFQPRRPESHAGVTVTVHSIAAWTSAMTHRRISARLVNDFPASPTRSRA